MTDKFVINGGKKLSGTIEVLGSKNAALPILAASVLTKEECVIDNVPLIEDVLKMIKLLEEMGAKVEWLEKRKIKISCEKLNPEKIDDDIMGRFSGSVLLWGAMAARFDNFETKSPGGCVIGARPLDTHLDAFFQMGVNVVQKDKTFNFTKPAFTEGSGEAKNVVLDEFSVTATENVLLFASAQNYKTTLQIADQDYQVQELIKVLVQMGAEIKYSGPHIFEINGTENLKGFSCKIIGDPIEAGTFIVAVLATKGEVLIKNVETQYLTLFLKKIKSFGAILEFPDEKSVKVLPSPNLVMNKIQSMPYPGIQPDLQPEFGVLATQTKGDTLIHDPLYEGRLKYLEELNKMGANIVFCDPHRAIVNGPTTLRGIEVPSLDIRGGAALIIAGLIAEGVTTINNAYQIDRGYEKIEERLQKLGADI
ncbi:MAG: UDP-N-acetylglucosamine 1-carboxyvinyltransferase, partial [Candidatus Staskawiczbacteria bacterium]|nr:UDP-N-acetylglucosamine 1-carboxyvinyltransferase [Candidatus Staskawiczbacteria bacterium]